MKSQNREISLLKSGDVSIYFLLIIFFIVLLLQKNEDTLSGFSLYHGDSLLFSLPPSDTTITCFGDIGGVVVQIKDKKASVLKSSCNKSICIHSHPISSAREEIICVPNRIVIEGMGVVKEEIDVIVQ